MEDFLYFIWQRIKIVEKNFLKRGDKGYGNQTSIIVNILIQKTKDMTMKNELLIHRVMTNTHYYIDKSETAQGL